MKALIEKIGGRKMILAMLVFIVSTVLVYFTKLEQESYFILVKYLLLSYLGGNVAQSGFVKKLDDKRIEFAEEVVGIITEGQTLDQMGGRKFLLVIGIYLTVTILLIIKTLDSSVYVEIVNWTIATYILANVSSKAVSNGMTINIGKAPEPTADTIKAE